MSEKVEVTADRFLFTKISDMVQLLQSIAKSLDRIAAKLDEQGLVPPTPPNGG